MSLRTFGLSRVVQVLRRRALIIVVVLTAVVFLAALRSVTSDDSFAAGLEMTVLESSVDDPLDLTPDRNVERALTQELRILRSSDVEASVEAAVGSSGWSVELDSSRPDLLTVDVVANDADLAAEVANTYAAVFVERRRTDVTSRLEATRTVVVERIEGINEDIAELEARQLADPTDMTAELLLAARVEQLGVFIGRLDELDFRVANATSGIAVGAPAEAPGSATGSGLARDLVLALIVGSILAGAIALAVDAADDRLYDEDDVERWATELDIVGQIPSVDVPHNARGWAALTTEQSEFGESLRSVRATVFHGLNTRRAKVLQVVSSTADEGATTVSASLGTLLARSSFSVIVVDADLAAPAIRDAFDLEAGPGLVDVLNGRATLDEAVRYVDSDGSLAVLTSGTEDRLATDLLAGNAAAEVIDQLRERFDFVLVDSPPLLTQADASTIAGLADLTLLVLGLGRVRQREMRRAIEVTELVGAEVLGAVLTQPAVVSTSWSPGRAATPTAPPVPLTTPDGVEPERDESPIDVPGGTHAPDVDEPGAEDGAGTTAATNGSDDPATSEPHAR